MCVYLCVRECVWGIRDDGCSMDVIDVQHDCDVNVNFACMCVCVCEFARSSLWQKWLVDGCDDGGDGGDGVLCQRAGATQLGPDHRSRGRNARFECVHGMLYHTHV